MVMTMEAKPPTGVEHTHRLANSVNGRQEESLGYSSYAASPQAALRP
mgnify:CR=1 FL=1